jgi:hypothetical protein
MLDRALRQHRLPAFSCRYVAALGIDLISAVDYENETRGRNVFVYEIACEDWIKLNSPSTLERQTTAHIPFRSSRWTREQARAFWIWEAERVVKLVAPKDGGDILTVEHLIAIQKKVRRGSLYTERQWQNEVYGPSLGELLPAATGSRASFERAVASGKVEADEFGEFDPDEVQGARRPAPRAVPEALAAIGIEAPKIEAKAEVIKGGSQAIEGVAPEPVTVMPEPADPKTTGRAPSAPQVAAKTVSQSEIEDFLESMKKPDGLVPTQVAAWAAAQNKFQDHHVPRQRLRDAHTAVFGPQLTGPRRKNSAK